MSKHLRGTWPDAAKQVLTDAQMLRNSFEPPDVGMSPNLYYLGTIAHALVEICVVLERMHNHGLIVWKRGDDPR